jgi:hypothetical protein
MSDPEWMTEAEQKFLEVEGHEAVAWEHFGDMMAERGEHQVQAVEMRRDEPSSEGPSPNNDVVITTVLAASSDILVAALKTSTNQRWLVEAVVFAIGMFFKSI